MAMLCIPAGEFEMGSSQAQIDAALEACERDRGAAAASGSGSRTNRRHIW
jgi:hypothetical protein